MMARSLVAVVAASSLVSACTPKHSVMAAEVGVLAAGAAVRIASDPSHCGASDLASDINCGARGIAGYYVGYALIAVGAALLVGTAVLWPEDHAAPPAPLLAPTTAAMTLGSPAPADSDLGRLARRAGIAARAGHCYEVQQLARAIDKLDRSYRERELERDAAIAMCLD